VPGLGPGHSADASANVVVPYKVAGGGEIRFTLKPRYTIGGPAAFALDVSAGSAEVIGPLSGIVLGADLPGEQTVRHLAPDELQTLDVPPGQRGKTTIDWDAKTDDGYDVPAGTYNVSLDFVVGGVNQRVAVTLELRAR